MLSPQSFETGSRSRASDATHLSNVSGPGAEVIRTRFRRFGPTVCGIAAILTMGSPAAAQLPELEKETSTLKRAGDILHVALPVTAALSATFLKDWEGLVQFGFSMGAASGTVFGFKEIIEKSRPDNEDARSFPPCVFRPHPRRLSQDRAAGLGSAAIWLRPTPRTRPSRRLPCGTDSATGTVLLRISRALRGFSGRDAEDANGSALVGRPAGSATQNRVVWVTIERHSPRRVRTDSSNRPKLGSRHGSREISYAMLTCCHAGGRLSDSDADE